MNRPLVSVVTPFHNTGLYLDECIRSVRAQSYTDFEYLLLDNCSTDNSAQIAHEHAAADNRIRVISNDSILDQVANYNRALGLISKDTRYCKLVQADDWIHPRCLEEMVSLADSDPDIGLVSSFRLQGRMVTGTGLSHTERVLDGHDVCRRQLREGSFFFGSPTTVMYRADLVRGRDPFFESGRLHEDTEKCYQILQSHKFGFVHEVLSFSRTDNESMMSRARRYNASSLDRLICIERFGPTFLDANEFARLRDLQLRSYFQFLGSQWLRNRDLEFWRYHRRGLASIGRTLPMATVAVYAAREMAWNLVNPGMAIARAVAALRRRNM